MKYFILSLGFLLLSFTAFGGGKKSKQPDDLETFSRTNIDFNETLIEGQMKAPQGFFLQGRKSQDLTQMVKLRSNFRNELRNSKSAVRSVVK